MKKIHFTTLVMLLLIASTLKAQTKTFSIDDHSIFSVYHLDKPTKPKTPPMWPKGQDSLQEYSDAHLNLSGVKLDLTTHMIPIGFKVNKNGTVSDVRYLSIDSSAAAQRAFKMVKNMHGWIPAKYKKGASVNCYTKLVFTINYNLHRVKMFKPR